MRKRRKRLSKATICGVIVLTVVTCAILFCKEAALIAHEKECATQIRELERRQRELEKEQKDLEEFRKYVETDEYAEEVAREKFGLVYEGEIIFEPEPEK